MAIEAFVKEPQCPQSGADAGTNVGISFDLYGIDVSLTEFEGEHMEGVWLPLKYSFPTFHKTWVVRLYKPLNYKFVERMRAVIAPGSPLFAYDDKDSNYSRDALFLDPVHMIRTGAEYFTKDLIRFMKKSLTTEE